MIDIRKAVTGPIETNTYIIKADDGRTIIVDPSIGQERVLATVKAERLDVAAAILTHCHFDHFGGLDEVLKAFPNAEVCASPDAGIFLSDPDKNGSSMMGRRLTYTGPRRDLPDGIATVAGFEISVFLIPGHSPCGLCFLLDGNLFSGDVLFAGTIGRTDFPFCSEAVLLDGIRNKLLPLSDDTVVWPGHGGRTTIGREKRLNPFLAES